MPEAEKTSSNFLPSKTPVLVFESRAEFQSLRKKLADEIKPKGIVEEFYLDDIAALVWEIKRLRDCKISTTNKFFLRALKNPLDQLLYDPEFMIRIEHDFDIDYLLQAYFDNDAAKTEISVILARFTSTSRRSQARR